MTSKKIDSSSKVEKSCNSYRGFPSKTARILKVLRESERPLKPKEIAFLSKINHSTTRSYLRRMLERGKVSQPYSGNYVAKHRYGLSVESKPLVHNLLLGVDVRIFESVRRFVGWFGGVKVNVGFDVRRDRASCKVSCDAGMDLDKTFFAIDKFKQVVFDRLGVRVREDSIDVVSCELNEDNSSIRLDGVNCVTVKDFRGYLERIYNKDDAVRSEIKVKPQSLESMFTLLKGGMTPYQILQSVGLLRQDIQRQMEISKQTNRLLVNVLGALRELKP